MAHKLVYFFLIFFNFVLPSLTQAASKNSLPAFQRGKVRISFLNPIVVRLEYSPTGVFVDSPTLFAQKRDDFLKVTTNDVGNRKLFRTKNMDVLYTPDDRPFSSQNLQIRIVDKYVHTVWVPGVKNLKNLGGAIESLDRYDGLKGPVPVDDGLLSRDGWGLVDDSGKPILKDGWVQASNAIDNTDLYFFSFGSDYPSALKALADVSGNIPIPRKYTFGSWYSRYWKYSQDEFKTIVNEYNQHDFPLDIMVMDTDWHLRNWSGYTWNKDLIPDGKGLISWMHDQGLAVTLNDHPSWGMAACEENYIPFMQALNLTPALCKGDPNTADYVWFQPDNQNYMSAFTKFAHGPRDGEGVDFWWLDWQQWQFTAKDSVRVKLDGSKDNNHLPEDIKSHAVKNLEVMPWLNRYYFDQSESKGERGLSFSRWGGWGDQKNPIHFSGDTTSNFETLKYQIPFTVNSSNSGAFFWTHDTGGHLGGRNEESYVRWAQFTSMSATLRLHSSSDPQMDRRPWTYSSQAESALRDTFHLRSELLPYIYTQASKAYFLSFPLLRPMYFNFSQTEAAYHQPQEYFFGDDLIVAPITEDRVNGLASQNVWLPNGEWYDYFSNQIVSAGHANWAGSWGSSNVNYDSPDAKSQGEGIDFRVSKSLNEFPLFVRAGSVIPMQPYRNRMTQTPLTELVVRGYLTSANSVGYSTLYEDDGITNGYQSGENLQTPLSIVQRQNKTRINVYAATGNYPQMIKTRNITFEFVGSGKVTHAFINDQEVPFEFDPSKNIYRVRIQNAPTNQTVFADIDRS
jgi:alpha-glucosidase (family GH31 glycosyl hydrolase)